jgi:hypothetical protein
MNNNVNFITLDENFIRMIQLEQIENLVIMEEQSNLSDQFTTKINF